jgi:uncharacterized SAM-binding protein YcdF (DUF218 family)
VHFTCRACLRAFLTMVVTGLLVVALVVTSGSFLIVNQPRKSDVIVILAGETEKRPARGLELLSQGFAPRLILDVPAEATIYQWNQLELAQQYVENLPQAAVISLCPIHALSTKGEAQDVSGCLTKIGALRVLLVTSDFHTRRTLSTFKLLCPQYDFSVAAAFDQREFGAQWWRRRQWAKVNFDEWIRLVWWQLVDRWR